MVNRFLIAISLNAAILTGCPTTSTVSPASDVSTSGNVEHVDTCSPRGVYGITFGSKPNRVGKKLFGNDASLWYAVQAVKPDQRFDSYEIRIDTESQQIFEIVAVKQTYRMPANGVKYSLEKINEGYSLSRKFVLEYIATLPPEIQATLVDKYGAGNWDGAAADGYHLGIATSPYEVRVSCKDNEREWAVARRVMPEIFKR